MGFTSLAFLVFFSIVWLVYLMLPGRFRTVWLLAASYVFLGTFGTKYLAVLIGSTLVTWVAGLILEKYGITNGVKKAEAESKAMPEAGKSSDSEQKKSSLATGVFVAVVGFHVAVLCFFKYNRSNIALPIGISFYTFQAIGYLTDVYRGTVRAEHNLLNFALFQAFFPKLVQGPIERSGNLLRQIQNIGTLPVRDPERIRRSALLLLWGLCEKLLIADRIAIPVNAVYSQFGAFGGVEIILATALYAFQIYCDFAGYTDMGRGIAGLLGFDLLVNFKRPYQADSVQDFWRRWHLSLSSFLRDYVYIPLGGSRRGRFRRAVNILITFGISGIWHGTGFHFLLWGLLHGIGQIFDIKNWKVPRAVKRVLIFLFVDATWMVFRVNSLGDLKGMLRVILTNFRLQDFAGMQLGSFEWVLLVFGILAVIAKDVLNEKGFAFQSWILERNAVLRCLIYTALLGAVLIFGVYGAAYDTSGFLYTQF
ncbi:MBOAT family O-acyltransferase [Laedolimicola sp.]|uniref:MBOAT family O-acyltransferase n=1 Tax=Laedolimicola sp. TaxID=2981663 RepID=UPI003F81A36E